MEEFVEYFRRTFLWTGNHFCHINFDYIELSGSILGLGGRVCGVRGDCGVCGVRGDCREYGVSVLGVTDKNGVSVLGVNGVEARGVTEVIGIRSADLIIFRRLWLTQPATYKLPRRARAWLSGCS